MTPHRPIGITIIAILAAIATIIAAIHTLQYLHILPFFLGPMAFFSFDLWGALLWALMTVVYAWVVVQLWNVNPQGWMFLVLISALNIILDILSIIGATTLSAVLPSIVINAIVLIYVMTPGVKRAFGTEAVGA
ncbi:MAG: hypothetical protein JO352_26365 [Chloroflexi bacterium]|nr:hypothetical protein [Chloroflexota bacterium]MBV9602810.1 hypothetical protein [Chloroflexota bacterium]